MRNKLSQFTGLLLCSFIATQADAENDKLPPPPSHDQIASFKTSHINPRSGVKLSYEVRVIQPDFKKPPKQGNYIGIQTAWYETYLRGRIPIRVTASFKYAETDPKNPAGERKKFGAYYTPPTDTYVLVRDEGNKIVSYFQQTAAQMCLH